MKPSSAKAKGRSWETAGVFWLLENYPNWPGVERRRLAGVNDKGDLAGIRHVCGELKAERSYKPGEWLREAERERINAGAEIGFVWAKLVGKTDPGAGVIMLTPDTFFTLLRKAGY